MDVKVQKVEVDYGKMPRGVTYYFIGQPKTGKSTQASKWSEKGSDGVIVIDTDLGADFVEGANIIPVVSYSQPMKAFLNGMEVNPKEVPIEKQSLIEYVITPPIERGWVYRNGKNAGKPMEVYSVTEVWQWLKSNWGKLPYDTIVLDTVDQINEWIEDEVKELMNISEMGMGDYGADWAKARRINADVVKKIQSLVKKTGGNLILISHSKNTQIQDEKVQLGPSLPGGLGRALTAKADIIGFTEIGKTNNAYMINFRAYDERSVGSRIAPLAQKKLPFDYSKIKEEILKYKPTK